jgi:hypothetical protein
MVGAGSALAGVAAARIIDLDRERRAERKEAEASRRRDLDETRRIAYMALASRETDRYEVVATIANALAHHGSAIDQSKVMSNILTVVTGGPGDVGESISWLRREIARLTKELGEGAEQAPTPPDRL